MRVLIMGARGMLGTDLLNEWDSDELIPASSKEADLRDRQQVTDLVASVRPDSIVLAAAYTDVDGSERNRDQAFAVNGEGPHNVALAARAHNARVLFVSTDYVFDGASSRPYEPGDPTSPLNVYGESKAEGERNLRETMDQWSIVRTSWLFGASGPSFPEKILKAAETRPELTVVGDQVGSPTFTRDLARAIRDLVRQDARGIIHATNEGSCSWFEFAQEILRQAGRNSVRVLPISTVQANRLARRPAHSVLSPTSLHALGIRLRPWQEALAAYLQETAQDLREA
jgi:dTDP-4-dehydrorhamnose reductase